MFDFQSTLDDADRYAKDGNVSLATFHYWLIGFAYEDEEFPFGYTTSIGERGRKGFLKYARKHRDKILNSESYLEFKTMMSVFPTYLNYFANFERVVNSICKVR